MARLQVNPTRMELTRLKRRLVTAKRGHKLLKDKRDEMVRQFIALIRKNQSLRREVEQALTGALREFAFARAVMEPEAVEAAVLYPARTARLTLGEKNVMSVKVPVIRVQEDALTQAQLSYGLADTSAQLDGAIATMAGVLPRLVELAEIESTCNLLADEIEKTRRRVNALEYVMIPQTEETIRYITMKLEENERGALTRLMKVKDMIAERDSAG
ncbi:MAG: V-type ATP synthase subunit D [Oscillospiraceae bacterium]|jgi:V/A-type H+-transporting ATPase subunit D|nr:V-type ATP synthase subunit D [Oscillospiraceae bacterium]